MPYFRCGGGGGVTPFAFLIVNYPSTASVSATNTSGGKDLATGKKLFFVTGAGNCDVTITQSGKQPKTARATFSSADEGTSKELTLTFEYKPEIWVLDNWAKTHSGYGSAEVNSDETGIKFTTGNNSYRYYFAQLIDLTPFTMMTYTFLKGDSLQNANAVGFADGDSVPVDNEAFVKSSSDHGTSLTMDISTLNGSYYLMCQGYATSKTYEIADVVFT